ncbi:MAG: efflux RND transporter periplasmic adaptor subunit [Elusimicrobiales bacterium]|nr:efflux RND transporter periplasmic adaptor subunit [Elusimicrobiales bacterium]
MNRKAFISGIIALALLGGGLASYRHFHSGHGAQAQAGIYYCPMHPDYTSDRPGDCPICGMHLVKKERTAPAERKVRFYRNPMNPAVTSKVPMKDEMGMDYLPVYEEEAGKASVAGRGTVSLTPEKQRMIGLKTEKAAYRTLSKTVRASGKVAYDPDLYRAISEYRESLASYEQIKAGTWQEAIDRAKAVVESSKIKLRQLGIGEEQLESMRKTPGEYDNLLIAGEKVWIYAQIYEYESASVKPGQRAAITSRAYPGREFTGVVRSVDPIFSEETRTLRARIETDNPGGELRSEMYVEAVIKAELGTMLAVPVSAVLNTGENEIAFVMKDEGTFEPREVRTGRRNDDYAEIVSGLRAGEKVVTSANFMIDSESRMKAALGN